MKRINNFAKLIFLLCFMICASTQVIYSQAVATTQPMYVVMLPCSNAEQSKNSGFWKKFGKIMGTVAIIGASAYAGEVLSEKTKSIPLKIIIIGGSAIAGERVADKLFNKEKPAQPMCGQIVTGQPPVSGSNMVIIQPRIPTPSIMP